MCATTMCCDTASRNIDYLHKCDDMTIFIGDLITLNLNYLGTI